MSTSPRLDTDEETLKFKTPRVLVGQHVLCVTRSRRLAFLWQRFEIKDPKLWRRGHLGAAAQRGGSALQGHPLRRAGLLDRGDVHRAGSRRRGV